MIPAELASNLKILVEQRANCKATLLESRIVIVKLEDNDDISREIQTFSLHGHPTAKKAFVWQQERTVGTREPEFTVFLAIPPINSPEDALRDIVAQIYKNL